MLEDITNTESPEGTSVEGVTPTAGHSEEEWKKKQVEAYRRLQSDTDARIAAERLARQTVEAERDGWKQKYELQVSRTTVAESKASDAEQQVNLRNAARQAAATIRAAWGDEAGAAAETKLLAAQDSRHLTGLYHEFMMTDLPRMQRKEGEGLVTQQRVERAQTSVEGLTIAALPPTVSEGGDVGDIMAKLRKGLIKAKQSRLWKETPEAQALLREAEVALGQKIRDFGMLSLVLQRAERTHLVGGEKRHSKV